MTLDVVDEAIGTGVMSSSWFVSSQLWLDDLSQCLAQLNTVERKLEKDRKHNTKSLSSYLTPTGHMS